MFKLSWKLEVVNLSVEVEGVRILKGVNLDIQSGEVHALMGPNGSGKSTLSFTIMGHPRYKVVEGNILFNGKSILNLPPEKRALLGIFLAFQNPIEIPGAKLADFLFLALNKRYVSAKKKIRAKLLEGTIIKEIKNVGLNELYLKRGINEGFSGGEKKRAEILQLRLLKPKIALLDEPDSGLDIDGVKIVANIINDVVNEGTGVLLITHYTRILNYVKPDKVSVMVDGRIIAQGGHEIAEEIEEIGYEKFVKKRFK